MANGYSESNRRLSDEQKPCPTPKRDLRNRSHFFKLSFQCSASRGNAPQLKRFTVSIASVPAFVMSFCEGKPCKIAGGVYSEGWRWSTNFSPLQAVYFQRHAFPPQGSAPFSVQSSMTSEAIPVRKRALTANQTQTFNPSVPSGGAISACEKLGRNQSWQASRFIPRPR
jgi:hypothetical protein